MNYKEALEKIANYDRNHSAEKHAIELSDIAKQALSTPQQKTFTLEEIKKIINDFLPQADKNSSFFRAKQAILLELEELFTSFKKEDK